MTTGLFYHPAFLDHDAGFGHPESPERLTAVLDFLEARKAIDNKHLKLIKPAAATLTQLERVHPKEYIDMIHLASDREGRFDSDTRASKGSYNAALLAAGAGITAWTDIKAGKIDNAFALVRPPGHHANSNTARGFCLLNNISVVARHIIATEEDSRILILDIDVHHGNGTQEIHYAESEILYLGFHQDGRTLFPGYSGYIDELGEGSGKGYNVNLPFPPGTSDDSFMRGLKTLFPSIIEQFQPTAVLVSAGYDAHFKDYQIAELQLTSSAYHQAAELVMELANKICKGQVIMFLEGGYNLQALAESIYNTLVAMSGYGNPIPEKLPAEDARIGKYVSQLLTEIKKLLKPWWNFSK